MSMSNLTPETLAELRRLHPTPTTAHLAACVLAHIDTLPNAEGDHAMNTHIIRDARGEHVALLKVEQYEAEFIADMIERGAPDDVAGKDWREVARDLAKANTDAEDYDDE